jgi:hypothetical protein
MTSLFCRSVSRVRLCFSKAQPDTKRYPDSLTAHAVKLQEMWSKRTLDKVDASHAAQAMTLAAVGFVSFATAAQAGESIPTELAGLLDSRLIRTLPDISHPGRCHMNHSGHVLLFVLPHCRPCAEMMTVQYALLVHSSAQPHTTPVTPFIYRGCSCRSSFCFCRSAKSCRECIPFFPTQPLSICAGLLFGTTSGAKEG